MMNEERIQYLCERYLTDKATPSELEDFELALRDPASDQELKLSLAKVYQDFPIEHYTDLDPQVADQLFLKIVSEAEVKRPFRLWFRIATVAAILVLLFSAVLYISQRADTNNENKSADIHYANDVEPGKLGATLTLADGKKIRLNEVNNGQLALEDGMTISKTADGQLLYQGKLRDANANNILSTARGETFMVTLPDRSKVWLNASSSLTYSTNLIQNGIRAVKLVGEAYFEIAKDSSHPFVVESKNQQVEVLGTHFNINAYPDEAAVKTTLLEGSVKIKQGTQITMLKPGIQGINTAGTIKLRQVDADLVVAWKDNNFIFDRLPITEIMKMVERWYDVKVVYKGEISDVKFVGSVSRFDRISVVLSTLEKTGMIHFETKGKVIYVSK